MAWVAVSCRIACVVVSAADVASDRGVDVEGCGSTVASTPFCVGGLKAPFVVVGKCGEGEGGEGEKCAKTSAENRSPTPE